MTPNNIYFKKNMLPSLDIPQRILSELPIAVVDKIRMDIELSDDDKAVVRSYLDGVILHPENTVECAGQLHDLLEVYMLVGARINTRTVAYVRAKVDAPSLIKRLEGYENVTEDIVISLNKNPVIAGGFVNFCIMSADKGFKTYNFYAENFSKLIKSLERWVSSDAPCLFDCTYVVVIGSTVVATIIPEKVLVPSGRDVVLNLITETFGKPHYIDISFRVERDNSGAFQIRGIKLEGSVVNSAVECEDTAVLPNAAHLKLRLMTEKIDELTGSLIRSYAFNASVQQDIIASIRVNGFYIGESGLGGVIDGMEEGVRMFCSEFFDFRDVQGRADVDSQPSKLNLLDRFLQYFN